MLAVALFSLMECKVLTAQVALPEQSAAEHLTGATVSIRKRSLSGKSTGDSPTGIKFTLHEGGKVELHKDMSAGHMDLQMDDDPDDEQANRPVEKTKLAWSIIKDGKLEIKVETERSGNAVDVRIDEVRKAQYLIELPEKFELQNFGTKGVSAEVNKISRSLNLSFFKDATSNDRARLAKEFAESGSGKTETNERSYDCLYELTLKSSPKPMPEKPVQKSLFFVGLAATQFKDDYFPPLKFCDKDISALEVLFSKAAKQETMNFIPMLAAETDTTRSDAISIFDELVEIAQPDDTVVFAFATHGVNLQRGLYLVLPTSKATSMQATSIDWESIASCISRLKAGRVVVLLDACHAGSFAESNLAILNRAKAELASRPGLTVISASDAANPALELTDGSGHGAFTQSLLDVLPDSHFPWEAGSSLFTRIKDRVSDLTNGKQTPVLTLDVPEKATVQK